MRRKQNKADENTSSIEKEEEASLEASRRLFATTPDSVRFQLELEFVQALANPLYVHHLAQQGYLDSSAMHNYLKYLQYWRLDSRYAKYVLYPQCFHFLKLLRHEKFREAMKNPRSANAIAEAQYAHWKDGLTKRFSSSSSIHQSDDYNTREGGGE